MILEGLFKLLSGLINLIPFSLPDMPDGFQNVLDLLFDGITNSLGLINLFIDLKFWLSCVAMCMLLKNIKHVWNGIIWVINLIPGFEVGYWN